MIKGLIVIPFFYPHYGGTQRYVEEIFSSMVATHELSVDILCYNTDGATDSEVYRGFNIYRVPCWNILPGRFSLPKPWHLIWKLSQLSKNGYSFVNTQERFFDTCWWVWFYAKLIGAKSIFTGHVPSHPVHQSKLVEVVAKTIDLTLAKWSLKKYDVLTFANKAAQSFFNKTLGVDKESEIVYIGVKTKEFKPRRGILPFTIPNTGVAVDAQDLLVTYLGRLIWAKGADIFFDVAAKIAKNNAGARFIIAGSGELENDLRAKREKLNLQEKILFTGQLNYEQIKGLLGHTHIFVNPSHHNEGLPNTLLEAGSSGCCVIATDNGATNELIEEGKTGYLIRPKNKQDLEDALSDAINNKEKREKYSENLREKIKMDFDWEISSEKLYGILSALGKSSS